MKDVCPATKLKKFSTEKGGWKAVRRGEAGGRASRVLRCNYCGYFHIVRYRSRG